MSILVGSRKARLDAPQGMSLTTLAILVAVCWGPPCHAHDVDYTDCRAGGAAMQACLDAGRALVVDAPLGAKGLGGEKPLRVSSGARITGLLGASIPAIVIAAGSHDVNIEGVTSHSITIEPGAAVRNIRISNVVADLVGRSARLENSVVIRLDGKVDLDSSRSGYTRDVVFLGCHTHGAFPAIILHGNTQEYSTRNVFVAFAFQTPAGKAASIDLQRSISFIGTSAESWNYLNRDGEWAPALNIRDSQSLHIIGASFGSTSRYPTPLMDLQADNIDLENISGYVDVQSDTSKDMPWSRQDLNSILVRDAKVLSVEEISPRIDVRTLGSGATSGKWVGSLRHGEGRWSASMHGPPLGLEASLPAGVFSDGFLSGEANERAWMHGSSGAVAHVKDDQPALQMAIDAIPQTPLKLSARVYSLFNPLTLRSGTVIVGAGTGRTILRGVNTPDVLRFKDVGQSVGIKSFFLSNFTVTGGRNGLSLEGDRDAPGPVFQNVYLGHLEFIDLPGSGIKVSRTQGLDSNFFESLDFIHDGIGIEQDPTAATMFNGRLNYFDKNIFLGCRFIENEIGVKMSAVRQDNQNTFIDSTFSGNRSQAIHLDNNDLFTIFGGFVDVPSNAAGLVSTGIAKTTTFPTVLGARVRVAPGATLFVGSVLSSASL